MSTKDDKDALWNLFIGLGLVVMFIFGSVVVGRMVYESFHKNSANTTEVADQKPDNPPPQPPSDKDSYGCYTPATVRSHYGETDCVSFDVGYTFETGGGTKFIDEKVDYQNGFVVYIPYNSSFSSVDLGQFSGKHITVNGYIKEYRGYPEIEATDYSQVKIFD